MLTPYTPYRACTVNSKHNLWLITFEKQFTKMYRRICIPRSWLVNSSRCKSTTVSSFSSKPNDKLGTASRTSPAAAASTNNRAQQHTAPELQGQGSQAPPFKRAQRGTFFQERPRLGNVYLEDAALQSYLNRYISSEVCLC